MSFRGKSTSNNLYGVSRKSTPWKKDQTTSTQMENNKFTNLDKWVLCRKRRSKICLLRCHSLCGWALSSHHCVYNVSTGKASRKGHQTCLHCKRIVPWRKNANTPIHQNLLDDNIVLIHCWAASSLSQGKGLNNTNGIRIKDNLSEGYELVQGHRVKQQCLRGKELNNTNGIRFEDNSSEGYELVQGARG